MHRHLAPFVVLVIVALSGLFAAASASAVPPGRNGALLVVHPVESWRSVVTEILRVSPERAGVERVFDHSSVLAARWLPTGTGIVGWTRAPIAGMPQTRFACAGADDCLLPGALEARSALPSPTGSFIAYVTDVDAGGTELWTVNRAGVRTRVAQSTTAMRAAWTPDGSGLIHANGAELWRTAADGSSIDRLVQTDCDGGITGLDTSPDGASVVYTCGRPDAVASLTVSRLDGSFHQRLADASVKAYSPTWSPDGTRIAYLSDARRGGYYSMATNGDARKFHALDLVPPYDSLTSLEWQSCSVGTDRCGARVDNTCWRDWVDTLNTEDTVRSYTLTQCRVLAGGRMVRHAGARGSRLDGGPLADRLVGGAGGDVLVGWGGADRIHGGAGDDRILGGAGNDHIVAGAGRDTIRCGPGMDVVTIDATDVIATDCEATTPI